MAQNTQYSDFTVSELSYSNPKKNSRGGISVWLNTSASDSSKPRVQLEKCRVPFGIREPMEAGGRKSLDLAVSSEALQQWCATLDERNIDTVSANSETFFKNKMSKEVVSEFYRKLVTPGKGDYEPLLKIKISEYEGNKTKVFLMKKDGWEEGTLEDVKEHCEVLPIVELQMLWFINKNFGMSMVATDLLVWPSKRTQAAERGFDFILPEPVAPAAPAGGAAAPEVLEVAAAPGVAVEVDQSEHGGEAKDLKRKREEGEEES
jgi:hypothetical protein